MFLNDYPTELKKLQRERYYLLLKVAVDLQALLLDEGPQHWLYREGIKRHGNNRRRFGHRHPHRLRIDLLLKVEGLAEIIHACKQTSLNGHHINLSEPKLEKQKKSANRERGVIVGSDREREVSPESKQKQTYKKAREKDSVISLHTRVRRIAR